MPKLNQKGTVLPLIVALLLVSAIGLGVYLTQQKTNLFPKADENGGKTSEKRKSFPENCLKNINFDSCNDKKSRKISFICPQDSETRRDYKPNYNKKQGYYLDGGSPCLDNKKLVEEAISICRGKNLYNCSDVAPSPSSIKPQGTPVPIVAKIGGSKNYRLGKNLQNTQCDTFDYDSSKDYGTVTYRIDPSNPKKIIAQYVIRLSSGWKKEETSFSIEMYMYDTCYGIFSGSNRTISTIDLGNNSIEYTLTRTLDGLEYWNYLNWPEFKNKKDIINNKYRVLIVAWKYKSWEDKIIMAAGPLHSPKLTGSSGQPLLRCSIL